MSGSQTVMRALTILRHIASLHPSGIGITALAELANLDRATTYRLTSNLLEFGLVTRDKGKNYRLGIEAMQLGLAAMRSAPIIERMKPIMQRIARITEDTVFLLVRNGDYGHCIHREEGPYPVKAMVHKIGGMNILGIGSAGLTLLSALSDAEILALYNTYHREYEASGLSLNTLKRMVTKTRAKGYAETSGIFVEGVSGIGIRFEIETGSQAAISLAAIQSRMGSERKQWIANLIADELRASNLSPSYQGAD